MPDRLLIVALLAACAAPIQAIELTLTPRALAEAIDLGQTRIESLRSRFHTPYRIAVSRPPVDDIEVVTPFRRVALAAETRARLGDRQFGQREALAMLGSAAGQIDLLIQLTFHPLNTYVGVPPLDVQLLATDGRSAPPTVAAVERYPRFGVRTQPSGTTLTYPYGLDTAIPVGTQPLTGGMLVVHLEGADAVVDGVYDLRVSDSGKEVARARIDFRGLR